jgi:arylsulfatase A-like enzyme
MYAAENPVTRPLHKAAISMRKERYKVIAYFGYLGYDNVYEMYDLANDPEEMHDLTAEAPSVFTSLKDELLLHLERANQPYEG